MDASLQPDLLDSLRLELRRGCLVLAVLAQLHREHYGYTLRRALADAGLEIEESTLYPLLRRLETQSLLTSEWREEDRRNKRFYRRSATGDRVFAQLHAEWEGINASLNNILSRAATIVSTNITTAPELTPEPNIPSAPADLEPTEAATAETR